MRSIPLCFLNLLFCCSLSAQKIYVNHTDTNNDYWKQLLFDGALNSTPLDHFSCERIDNAYITLKWSCKSTNAEVFIIERLLPLEGVYEVVGRIQHQPGSSGLYQFIDENAYFEKSFYRLSVESLLQPEVLLHEFTLPAVADKYANSISVALYPNPTQGQLMIELKNIADPQPPIRVSLLTVAGKVVHQFETSTDKLYRYPGQYIQQLDAGMYTLKIDFKDGRQTIGQFVRL